MNLLQEDDQINALVDWINHFDPSHLQNEDDVETKFVLPLFQKLNYSDEYRHGKYPIDDYKSEKGKPGRKNEIDQIYFSVSDPNKQSLDTSLIIVEAKEPQIHNLEGAIKQAKYYGNHMTPVFLIVTDGHRLKVFKRHHYRSEETIFDIYVNDLRNRTTASKIYNQLHFEQVKTIKEHGTDPLAHALYIDMINLSQRYPDIQTQLAKGDFETSITQEGRLLTVIKPKVAIKCKLPIVFEEGSCSIEFSNIMLRGLTCHLSHSEILSTLLIGLKTSPFWGTRPFLYPTENGMFEANLGQTIVILSADEAQELCDTIDEVFHVYKKNMIEAADKLETWDFSPVKTDEGSRGFHILSVKKWLWELMLKFSQEFDYDEGTSEWHIFYRQNLSIRVEPKHETIPYIVILPKAGDIDPLSEWIDLLYVDGITYLHLYLETSEKSLFEVVGPKGVWTAPYSKKWIMHHFIPQVLTYYSKPVSSSKHSNKNLARSFLSKNFSSHKQSSQISTEQLNILIQQSTIYFHEEKDTPLSNINKPKELAQYLHKIQSYLLGYGAENVPTINLRPYYTALTELARTVDLETTQLNYLQQKLGVVQRNLKKRQDTPLKHLSLTTYSDILNYLEQQVKRIYETDYEYHIIAELISRAFIDIIETKISDFQQEQLNAAKKALQPLWEEYRFHRHFIEPINLLP